MSREKKKKRKALWGFSEKQSKEEQKKGPLIEEIPKGIETHSQGTRH
jgi:hypothetical protein